MVELASPKRLISVRIRVPPQLIKKRYNKPMKKIIIPIIVIAVLGFVSYKVFFKKEAADFTFTEVKRGTITQEVSETGQVQKGEKINLSFKNAGLIQKIYVKSGDKVKAGDFLAKLDTNNLQIQLSETRSALDVAQARLNKLMAGAGKEEIQSASTTVANAEIALASASVSLGDVKNQAENTLNGYYENAINTLEDAYLKAYNAKNAVEYTYRTYFYRQDQQSSVVSQDKDKINIAVTSMKSRIDIVNASTSQANIDTALAEAKTSLNTISLALKEIRDVCEEPIYSGIVSATDKTSLDTHRGYVNTAISSVLTLQQTITSTKLTNTTNINTYTAKVSAAQGALDAAEDAFAVLTAPPRKEDVDLYTAQLNQAKNQVQFLESQIADSILKSPTKGTITDVLKREGEIVQPSAIDSAMSMIPDSIYQIKVDVYEEDVVKMNTGNEVEISLVAFPDKKFSGKLIEINTAEKLKDGVIYYEVTIDFTEEIPDTVKTGMTADLIIKTATKENVLTLSNDAINKKNGGVVVEILSGKEIVEKSIEIGLKGSDGTTEIISGVLDGEKVIVR